MVNYLLYAVPGGGLGTLAAVVLKEKGIDFEWVPLDPMKGETRTAEHLQRNPFGWVPVMEEIQDGSKYTIYESRAMARYIALKYKDSGTPLIPRDGDLRAWGTFEQAAGVESSMFDAHASRALMSGLFNRFQGLPEDTHDVEIALKSMDRVLNFYEKVLSEQPYLLGDQISLVDLFHLPNGHILSVAGHHVFEIDQRPNVKRWWQSISSRPTWIAVRNGILKQTPNIDELFPKKHT